MKNSQKGFTLIELLVVIAIIGILATIVLTSLGSAQNKAKDSKISGQLSSMRAQAQLYSGTGTAFTAGVCATTSGTLFETANNGLGSLFTSTGTGTWCSSDGTLPSQGGKWAVAINNTAGTGSYCVDYTGTSKLAASTVAGSEITAHTCN